MPNCLITGINSQDGAYLAQFLLKKNYRVVGIVRQPAALDFAGGRLEALDVLKHVELLSGDLTDLQSLLRVVSTSQPDEVYNLAAQSSVASSWKESIRTGQVTGIGAHTILEATRIVNPNIRFYQASSSEMFGQIQQSMQTEKTPFYPRSPYAVAKLYAHLMTVNYREGFGMHASAGILFNHESPLRGVEFVTRKITDGVARIKLGMARELVLGNLEARRDWGHARDYVRAMWLMLQHEEPGDYVVGTGETHSVKEFVAAAFACADLDWQKYVVVDQRFFRPAEVELLCADLAKARRILRWEPEVSFHELVRMMVEADLQRLKA